jgi:hypothetical protein
VELNFLTISNIQNISSVVDELEKESEKISNQMI